MWFPRVQNSEEHFQKIELRAPWGAPGWIFLSFQRRHQINAGSVFKLRTAIVKKRRGDVRFAVVLGPRARENSENSLSRRNPIFLAHVLAIAERTHKSDDHADLAMRM